MSQGDRAVGRQVVVAIIDAGLGAVRQVGATAHELRQRSVDLRVVVFRRSGSAEPESVRFFSERGIPCRVVVEAGPWDVRVVGRVAEVLREWGAVLIESHGYKASFVAAALRILGWDGAWIGFFHGDTWESRKVAVYNRLHKTLLRRADTIAVVARQQSRFFPGCGQKVVVIESAILPVAGAESPAVHVDRREADGRRPVLGVIGRLSPEKGVGDFLEACAILRRNGRDFTALIAGDGPERARLKTLARHLGLSGTVEFLGHVGPVDSLYQQLDLVVIPSRSEGSPNVLFEAIYAGIPVVATGVGGIPDVLGRFKVGVLVKENDPGDLAGAIDLALSGLSTVGSEEGRKGALQAYSVKVRAMRLLAAYARVAKLRRRDEAR